jgi:hypothetical protein
MTHESIIGHLARRAGAFCVALAAPLFLCLACSSTTNVASCGAGTVMRDGVCVADPDAFPVTDSAGVDGLPFDTKVEDADSASADTTKSDSTTDGPSSAADPCPSKAVDVNCSTTCGGINASCAQASCRNEWPARIEITSEAQLPFILRTPDRAGVDPNCQPRCGADNTVFGLGIRINFSHYVKLRYRAPAPWFTDGLGETTPYCAGSAKGEETHCFATETDFQDLLFATRDPDSPSRNLVIELAPDLSCP